VVGAAHTISHAVFAASMTLYIVIGTAEHDRNGVGP
jgi:hypothetical protein